jgi:hypothetical protein
MEHMADKYYENIHDRIRDKMPGKEPLSNSSKPHSSQSSRAPSRDPRDRYGDDYDYDTRRRSKRASSEPDGHHGSASGSRSHVRWNSDDRDDDSDNSDGYYDSDDSRRYSRDRDGRPRRQGHRRRSNSIEDSRSYVEDGRRRRSGESMGESTARGGYDATRIPSSQYTQVRDFIPSKIFPRFCRFIDQIDLIFCIFLYSRSEGEEVPHFQGEY